MDAPHELPLPTLDQIPPDVLLAAAAVLKQYGHHADRSLRKLTSLPSKAHRDAVAGNILYWKHVRAGLEWASNCITQVALKGTKHGQSENRDRVPTGRKASRVRRSKAG